MRRTYKRTLLASAAGAALAIGFGIGSANAFDRSYWTFNLDIDPCVDIRLNLDPDSMTSVEADQISTGDIKAVSIVKDITINQPDTGNGHDDGHGHDNWSHSMSPEALDALTQLGSIVSAATAVANNVNVSTETQATFADISQLANGGFWHGGDVSAKSIVDDIANLSVDSSATAVSNNANLAVSLASLSNASVVANVRQTSLMDVSAVSVVKDVTLSNYQNLGQLTVPVVSSVATAVGNNLNVSVTKK